jgi:hypothetical protein
VNRRATYGNCVRAISRERSRLASARIVSKMFGLSPRMLHLWVVYRKIPGPQMRQRAEPGNSQGSVAPAIYD